MRVYKCKACGAPIVWIKTVNEKSMPCDVGEVLCIGNPHGSKKAVTSDGRVISCEYTDDPRLSSERGYVPHWSTCPQANSFKKGRAKV